MGVFCLTIPYFIVCVLLLPWRHLRLRAGNWVGANAGRIVCAMAQIELKLLGNDLAALAPAIYVQNHSGTLDLWLAMQLCPAPGSGTMKRELMKVPFLGIGYLLSGHLILDRGNREQAIQRMREIHDLVHRHRISVWILPEGTRSRTGRLLPFKKGFAHMAIATRLPIVPVVVHKAHEIWPPGLVIRPGRVVVEVLDPIPTDSWSVENMDEQIAEVREVFLQHLGNNQLPEA
jgi:1-acyl-sn-glycerol-3-phosphate acyltransferase